MKNGNCTKTQPTKTPGQIYICPKNQNNNTFLFLTPDALVRCFVAFKRRNQDLNTCPRGQNIQTVYDP